MTHILKRPPRSPSWIQTGREYFGNPANTAVAASAAVLGGLQGDHKATLSLCWSHQCPGSCGEILQADRTVRMFATEPVSASERSGAVSWPMWDHW